MVVSRSQWATGSLLLGMGLVYFRSGQEPSLFIELAWCAAALQMDCAALPAHGLGGPLALYSRSRMVVRSSPAAAEGLWTWTRRSASTPWERIGWGG